MVYFFFFFQAEDGIRDLVRSRGLGDVYKRQILQKVIFAFKTLFSDDLFHACQYLFNAVFGQAVLLSLIHI